MTPLVRGSVVALATLAAAGCGPSTTEVSGKITFQGKPVVFGSVVVIDQGKLPRSGTIQPDGTFRISGVQLGSVKVAVSSAVPPGVAPPKSAEERPGGEDSRPPPQQTPVPPEVAKAWFPLPEKYGDPVTSELTFDVKPGQPLNIDLK